jgi:hypothetical protein
MSKPWEGSLAVVALLAAAFFFCSAPTCCSVHTSSRFVVLPQAIHRSITTFSAYVPYNAHTHSQDPAAVLDTNLLCNTHSNVARH